MTPTQVKALRHRHGITQTQLAKLCWCHRHTIHRWEHGDEVDPARFELAGLKLVDELAIDQLREWAEREVGK